MSLFLPTIFRPWKISNHGEATLKVDDQFGATTRIKPGASKIVQEPRNIRAVGKKRQAYSCVPFI